MKMLKICCPLSVLILSVISSGPFPCLKGFHLREYFYFLLGKGSAVSLAIYLRRDVPGRNLRDAIGG